MTRINPATLYDGSAHGLSHAVVDSRSGLIFVSGQVAWDLQHRVTSDTVEGQTKQALRNLRIILDEAGSSVQRLLQLRIYVRGELGDHLATLAPILGDWLGGVRPALTGIGVASLATPDTLVEIEAVATVEA